MQDFREFYDVYVGKVYHFVSRYISDGQDIEDVVQEVFVHIWKYQSFKSRGELLDQIVFKTAKQEIANFYRKNKISAVPKGIFEEIAKESDVFDEELQREQFNKVTHLIDKLPLKTREIFLKNKLERRSYASIAKEYNISKTAVEKHINRALKFIRENFASIVIAIQTVFSR